MAANLSRPHCVEIYTTHATNQVVGEFVESLHVYIKHIPIVWFKLQ